MATIRITLPENFDERYKKYREKFDDKKMPEPFLVDRLENEKKHLLLVDNEEEFKHEIDKWRPLKIIMDAIYKELSPFLPGSAQIIKIDLSKLGLPEKQPGQIFLMLAYERVCRWKTNKSSAVISTEGIQAYMEGEGIVVPDYEKFKELRNKINDFYKFMEDELGKKFPEVNPKDVEERVNKILNMPGKYGGVEAPVVPVIEYSDMTGKGSVDSVRGQKEFTFKDGSPEYKVFNMLYAKLGKKSGKLERLEVLVAGGFYEDHQQKLDPTRKTAETALINEIAKNIREKTGLNTKELVMNNGNLTLVATKLGKNPPKTTKFVPVRG